MDATTARLVDFASRAQYSALSSKTVHECKCRLIDTPACAVVVLATATGIGKLLGCTKEQMGNAVALIGLPRRVTTGHRTPIEMTSLGRAYLATLPAKERDILFARFRVKHRDHWEDLEHEIQHAIDQVHNEGYCEVNWLPGVTAIATPVRITGQTYVINIGVSSRSLHATRIRNELAPALLALANDLESAFASGESKKAQKKRADVRRGAHSAE